VRFIKHLLAFLTGACDARTCHLAEGYGLARAKHVGHLVVGIARPLAMSGCIARDSKNAALISKGGVPWE